MPPLKGEVPAARAVGFTGAEFLADFLSALPTGMIRTQKETGQNVLSLRLSKNPRRAREGRSPFELSIVPSGVYGGHGAIFAPENPIFQRKNRFLAVSAPEKSLIFSGDW